MAFESWGVAGPAVTAAFLASLVEVVEAFTIVLAVATLRGWRPAWLGTAAVLGGRGPLGCRLWPRVVSSISDFPEGGSFDTETTRVMGEAFDAACKELH